MRNIKSINPFMYDFNVLNFRSYGQIISLLKNLDTFFKVFK